MVLTVKQAEQQINDYGTTFLTLAGYFYSAPRVGWQFADGNGYRFKEPMNVPHVPTSHSPSAQRFLCGNGANPLLYMFR
jgi:hypothetical protein